MYGAALIVIVVNNGMFGTIRMHQVQKHLRHTLRRGQRSVVWTCNSCGPDGSTAMRLQEREYPGRVSGTSMTNPDFAALAVAYGGHGETVETTEQFVGAWERSVASGLPAIIVTPHDCCWGSVLHSSESDSQQWSCGQEVKIDPEAITATTTITKLREASSH